MYVGMQGTFKDVCAVKECYEAYLEGKKIFSTIDLGFDFTKLDTLDDMCDASADNWV